MRNVIVNDFDIFTGIVSWGVGCGKAGVPGENTIYFN